MPLAPFHDLRTPRLTVRPIAEPDLRDLLAVNGDPEVTRFLPYPRWSSEDDARSWLTRMRALAKSGTARQLVAALNDGGTVVGTILVFKFDEGSARAELGYVLGRAYWGQGLMQEALRGLCRYAFGEGGLRRLEAEVAPANAPSNALLGKLGFVREGLLRKRWVAKGVPYDTHIYGALRDEWLAANATG